MSQRTPHIFMPEYDDVDSCRWCGLPEHNKIHNARPVRVNPRTKREEYTDE